MPDSDTQAATTFGGILKNNWVVTILSILSLISGITTLILFFVFKDNKEKKKHNAWKILLSITGICIFLILWIKLVLNNISNSGNKAQWYLFTIGLFILAFIISYLIVNGFLGKHFWFPSDKCENVGINDPKDGDYICNELGCNYDSEDEICVKNDSFWNSLSHYLSSNLSIIILTIVIGVTITLLLSNVIWSVGIGKVGAAASATKSKVGEGYRGTRRGIARGLRGVGSFVDVPK